MASATASCPFCNATFTGYGKTHNEAVSDANNTATNHAFSCPSNPANKED